mmetsp:Transcript_95505/g.270196  ORF Transcript_95505/g.270196 Transcript_95505/m.270196 type:complete len:295 (+) Transcript_95505:97-981(+)
MGDAVWLRLVEDESVLNEPDAGDGGEEREGLATTPSVHDVDDELASFATPRKDIPNDTLIIFDWDDTLLCSSAINMQQWSQLQLDVLCRTVETTLRAAMELGEVMIVTNGVDWWVEDSCRRFLPGLLPLLGRLHVKSARHDYEPLYPGDPFAWKRETFKDILKPRPRATNLVVIGDSFSEIHAAHGALHCMVHGSLVKTVKFKEAPSANELIGQLRRVSQEMGGLVSQDSHQHHNMERWPAQFGHMAGWASGWRLSVDNDVDKSIGGLIPDAGNAGTDFSKGLLSVAAVPAIGA